MTAQETIERIRTTRLIYANLKYCLVSADKHPFKSDNSPARPNIVEDFVCLDELAHCGSLNSYSGLGVSIQASNICAIDVDHCFSRKNDLDSADERALEILDKFYDIAYCEFSFSGTGLRVIFRYPIIANYSDKYYIKNAKNGIEFYQPTKSFRYVTVTGNVISDVDIDELVFVDRVHWFLDKFMLKPKKKEYDIKTDDIESRSFEQLQKQIKRFYLTDLKFQDLWFGIAPGSGKNESELDYQLLALMYENVTKDKELLKQLFESSPYFHTKDFKHISKWKNQEGRYFNYIYDNLRRTKC